MKKKGLFFAMLAMVLTFGMVLVGCDNDTTDDDGLTMSDYLKYVQPRSEDWGDRLVTNYQLNPEYKEEIITVFSNENRLVISTYSRDWELGNTVFRYVELRELKSGTNSVPRFLDYSASDSDMVTEYMAFDEPEIGYTVVRPWDEGDTTIEYLGQKSPASLTFTKEPRFGRWMYPGYYKLTLGESVRHRYLHIIGGSDGAELTDWLD